MFVVGRILRDIKANLMYPVWVIQGKPAPDNHIHKRKRILTLAKCHSCSSFIETGTFYGQMVNAVKNHFDKALSVELFEPLYYLNKAAFTNAPHIFLYHGDSALELTNMIKVASGRILFWLDGHYSGDGTACGAVESPILSELDLIKRDSRNDHCILIDDARLFTGQEGYPTFENTRNKLLEINHQYKIIVEHDCIIALT
jgi:hypothetical protein